MTKEDGGPDSYAVVRAGHDTNQWVVMELDDDGDERWYEPVCLCGSYPDAARIRDALAARNTEEESDDA